MDPRLKKLIARVLFLVLCAAAAFSRAEPYSDGSASLDNSRLSDWAQGWADCVAGGGSPEACAGNAADAAGVGDQVRNAIQNSFFNQPSGSNSGPPPGSAGGAEGFAYNQPALISCSNQNQMCDRKNDPIGCHTAYVNCARGVANSPPPPGNTWVNPYGP